MQAFTSYEAAEYGYLNNPPAVTMHPRRLHSDALAVGKMLLVNFVPRNFSNKLTIPDTTLLKRKADILVIGATDPHDQTVRQKLLTLFTAAGDAVTTVENLHKLERKLFIELLQTEEVLQRMQKLLHPEVRGL